MWFNDTQIKQWIRVELESCSQNKKIVTVERLCSTFSFKTNIANSCYSFLEKNVLFQPHLDRASDLHGSSPANNQHSADLALYQGLQGWLGDVSLLKKGEQSITVSWKIDFWGVLDLFKVTVQKCFLHIYCRSPLTLLLMKGRWLSLLV